MTVVRTMALVLVVLCLTAPAASADGDPFETLYVTPTTPTPPPPVVTGEQGAALAPDADPRTTPTLWRIYHYGTPRRRVLGVDLRRRAEPRLYARAPRDAWDPTWRSGREVLFYEKADGALRLIGRGRLLKSTLRRYEVRVEAIIESFLYEREGWVRVVGDPVRRPYLDGRRKPRRQDWYMAVR